MKIFKYLLILLCLSLVFCKIDSDGDGYLDLDELFMKKNPNDPFSRIYEGGWPFNNKKKFIDAPQIDCPNGIGCECEIIDGVDPCVEHGGNCISHFKGDYCSVYNGSIFPEFVAEDQFGEMVNIYDFANNGKYILIELGTVWCSPCNTLASLISYGDNDIKSKGFWKSEYDLIIDMIKQEEVYFITVLYEDEFRDNATSYTAYEWYDNYPEDNILVLADEFKILHSLIKPTGIPTIILVNENMEIVQASTRGFNGAFDKLLDIKAN